jgi:predicted small secreted protein
MKHSKILRLTVLSLLALSTATLAACTNTVHGAGQDIERAGDAVQDSVE